MRNISHGPEGFILTGMFLADKETKYKAAEGKDLLSKSKIILIENKNHYTSTGIKQKQKKHLLRIGY